MKLESSRKREVNHKLYFDNINTGNRKTPYVLANKSLNYKGAWIRPPQVFALHADPQRTQLINVLNCIKSQQNPKVDFRNVEYLLPAGFIYFLSFLDFNAIRVNTILGRCSKSGTVREMLNSISHSYDSNARHSLKDSKNSMISRWRFYQGATATFPDDYDEVENFIKAHTKNDDEFLLINSAISEAVTNVINHAYIEQSECKWWMFVGLNNKENNLAVLVNRNRTPY